MTLTIGARLFSEPVETHRLEAGQPLPDQGLE